MGLMLAIADEEALYLLEFENRIDSKSRMDLGRNQTIDFLEEELHQYFAGKLTEFQTRIRLAGTDFQRSVWQALLNIPYGKTRSYAAIAATIGKPTAYRAAALANGANPIGIIVSCHRVINQSGALGGYGGGIERKKRLLELERSHATLRA